MKIDKLDNLVLTVQDIDATASFYAQILGMEIITRYINGVKNGAR